MKAVGLQLGAIVAVAAIALGGCAKRAAGDRPATPTTPDPRVPVARVGGEVITEAELASSLKREMSRIEAMHAERVHRLRTRGLEKLVAERLIKVKARSEGLSPEQLMAREVTSKEVEPTPEQIRQAYDGRKGGARPLPPFEQVKEEIRSSLRRGSAQAVHQGLLERLRRDTKVEILLPPLVGPRIEVAAEGPSKGNPKAPVTIVEFSDFECPYCAKAEPVIKQVLQTYEGKVRLVYRDFALPFHTRAAKAAEASLCADAQGRYSQMREKLFSAATALEPHQLKEHARALGLDGEKFDQCLDGGDKGALVAASKKAALEAGAGGTPAFFINGRMLAGQPTFERLRELIDHELSSASRPGVL